MHLLLHYHVCCFDTFCKANYHLFQQPVILTKRVHSSTEDSFDEEELEIVVDCSKIENMKNVMNKIS